MKWGNQQVVAIAAAMLALAIMAGCGRSAADAPSGGSYRARANLYSAFMTAHKRQSPKSEAEFRQFLATQQPKLEQAGLTVDQMFISPRNNEALEWVYGKRPPMAAGGLTILGYEKSAKDGQRLIVGTRGIHLMMDDAQFKRLFPNTE